MRLTII